MDDRRGGLSGRLRGREKCQVELGPSELFILTPFPFPSPSAPPRLKRFLKLAELTISTVAEELQREVAPGEWNVL